MAAQGFGFGSCDLAPPFSSDGALLPEGRDAHDPAPLAWGLSMGDSHDGGVE